MFTIHVGTECKRVGPEHRTVNAALAWAALNLPREYSRDGTPFGAYCWTTNLWVSQRKLWQNQ